MACSRGHLEIVKLLLEHGANINHQNHVRMSTMDAHVFIFSHGCVRWYPPLSTIMLRLSDSSANIDDRHMIDV